MNFTKGADIVLNVIIPLLGGVAFYYISSFPAIPAVLNNYLADGLWAYSFISALLIIWDRQINMMWLSVAGIMSVGFEIFQYNHLIAGTGDVYDVITYFLFFSIALKLNCLFKIKTKNIS